jgi:hypothetical protein
VITPVNVNHVWHGMIATITKSRSKPQGHLPDPVLLRLDIPHRREHGVISESFIGVLGGGGMRLIRALEEVGGKSEQGC